MRWVVAHPGPSFSVADVHVGWVEALRELGQHVIEFNLDDRLACYAGALRPDAPGRFVRMFADPVKVYELAADGLNSTLYKARPQVLLVVSAMFIPPEILDRARSYGTRVIVLHTESPYEDDRQLRMAAHADINLINDPLNAERFAEWAPTWYVPHAYRPSIHHPGAEAGPAKWDFSFVGTGYPSRIRFLEQMTLDGLSVALGGNWQLDTSPLAAHLVHDPQDCLDNAATADLYRTTRIGLNLYRREHNTAAGADGLAMGPREVEMAACGLFFLRDPRPEGDEVLHMLPRFTEPGEAGELLRWWLAHEDARLDTARQAREAVADRTFRNHAAALLRHLST